MAKEKIKEEKKATPKAKKAADFGKLFTETRDEFWQADYDKAGKESNIHNHYYQINKGEPVNFGRVAFGITMVFLGFIYLGVNMGWLSPTIKPDLWELWPLVLIFWGLSMLRGRTVGSILVGTIITLTIMGLTTILILASPQKTILENSSYYEPINDNGVLNNIVDSFTASPNIEATTTTSSVTSSSTQLP